MAIPVNPTSFQITDPNIVAQSITGFNVEFGRASGVYTLKAAVPAGDINATTGLVTGTIASLNEQLAPGVWFVAATAVNAGGESAASPEASFSIVPAPPTPPTGFSVA